ncbi:hypothetical protein F0U61_48480 [Archangium violaceum]|uniref:mannosyltransferase family protein n=1 Tax=Archangium violaceum TaxID=83451 RepID=UPI002B29630F|nr:hypothetical protein F0U61_48480 [Archangium violaceum]
MSKVETASSGFGATEDTGSSRRLWFALGLCSLMLVHHFGLWAWTAHRRGFPLLQGLLHWDSSFYSTIATQGYTPYQWAFLPLYPMTVRLVRAFLGGEVPPQVVGCVLSSVCLLAFVFWAQRRGSERDNVFPLAPRTMWGWFFFLYTPASYALHSHHTEGLFLLLSLGAFLSAWEERFWLTALFAGLCVWTRNQGMFVAVVAALLLAERAQGGRDRLIRFAGVGALTLAAFGGLLAAEWIDTGDPLAHFHAQANWQHVDSAWGALRTLWYGNPGQHLGGWSLRRGIFFALLLALSVAMLRKSRPLALYGLLSLAVMLPQGDFSNAFRFGAVLFPLLFLLGDWLATWPAWLRWPVAGYILVFNHKVTHGFIIGVWAY